MHVVGGHRTFGIRHAQQLLGSQRFVTGTPVDQRFEEINAVAPIDVDKQSFARGVHTLAHFQGDNSRSVARCRVVFFIDYRAIGRALVDSHSHFERLVGSYTTVVVAEHSLILKRTRHLCRHSYNTKEGG